MGEKININLGGGLLLQLILWILYYGNYVAMPWWVAWLPTLICITLISILLIILFAVALIS